MQELVMLALYFFQQAGVMLGVGAQTVILVGYLSAMRDRVVEPTEERFARAVRRVLSLGLLLIVASGIAITALHIALHQGAIVFQPTYLFKWILVATVTALAIFPQGRVGILPNLGFGGATWYALFVLHVLALESSWSMLFLIYGVWTVGFMLCWWVVAATTRDPKGVAPLMERVRIPSIPRGMISRITAKAPPPAVESHVIPHPLPASAPVPPPPPPPPPPQPPRPAPAPPAPTPAEEPKATIIQPLPPKDAPPLDAAWPLPSIEINTALKEASHGMIPIRTMPKHKDELHKHFGMAPQT
jgi:hypothetical protein